MTEQYKDPGNFGTELSSNQIPRRKTALYGESGYARKELDAYWTEPEATEALLRRVNLRGQVWEPACGIGWMSDVLIEHGYSVTASDIKNYGYPGQLIMLDFLDVDLPYVEGLSTIGTIFSNPPYSHAEAFIKHALEMMEPRQGLVAMFLRSEYDTAAGREYLFKDHPAFALTAKLTWRPRWSTEDKSAPRHNFSWFVWDWSKNPKALPSTIYLSRPKEPDGKPSKIRDCLQIKVDPFETKTANFAEGAA